MFGLVFLFAFFPIQPVAAAAVEVLFHSFARDDYAKLRLDAFTTISYADFFFRRRRDQLIVDRMAFRWRCVLTVRDDTWMF